tara:strand:+ start:36 stop:686 length:651 start_codon:yes stop_codon:yes gene_type:complete
MATVASGLNSGSGFGSSDTITSTTLNNHVNNATVTAIVNADVASNAALAVTKLADITNNNLLGRVDNANNASVPIVIGGSGDAGVLFDNDDMLDNSDTAGGSAARGATQQSIKAYVDNSSTDGFAPTSYSNEESVTLPNGLIMKWGTSGSISAGSQATITFGTAFPTACKNVQVTANNGNDNTSTGVISAQITDRTAMTIHNGKEAMTFFWHAIGY